MRCLLVFLALFLASCDIVETSPTPTDAEIIRAWYKPAHSEYEYRGNIDYGNGVSLPNYQWVHYSAQYYLVLKCNDCNGKFEMRVSEHFYMQVEIGESYMIYCDYKIAKDRKTLEVKNTWTDHRWRKPAEAGW